MIEARTMKLAIPVNERDHVIGPARASVTVVNYGDYLCRDFDGRQSAVEKIVDELINSVRFVYRHFPLVNVHSHALRAAEAAKAAAAQGKFWEMHRLLYSRSPKLGDRDLRRHGQEIGLDLDRFNREMASGIYADQIMKDRYNSIINGITGAPTTFINGVLYPMSGAELFSAVKAILEDHSSPGVKPQNGNNRSGPVRMSVLPWKR
jgi:protein-disulfide isomerase